MAKSDGLLFKSTSPVFHSVCSSMAGREQGLHQGCSVDRANKSRPMTCWIALFEEHASSVGLKRNWGGPSFECGAARGHWEVRGRGERQHLLPWLLAGHGDLAIVENRFSCSHQGNVTHFKSSQPGTLSSSARRFFFPTVIKLVHGSLEVARNRGRGGSGEEEILSHDRKSKSYFGVRYSERDFCPGMIRRGWGSASCCDDGLP